MEIIEECSSKMSKTIEALHTSLATIRSGKVSPSVLDRILVEYYGEMTPIKAMAGIQTPSSTQLLIRPFDNIMSTALQKNGRNKHILYLFRPTYFILPDRLQKHLHLSTYITPALFLTPRSRSLML